MGEPKTRSSRGGIRSIRRVAAPLLLALAGLVGLVAPAGAGTLVQFDFGARGVVMVDLFDNLTPQTVNSFVNRWVNRPGANETVEHMYDGTMIHRVTKLATDGIGVVQGGGFDTDSNPIYSAADPTVNLEYSRANSLGTLAMARSSDPNSALSQWFFNTTDNSTSLAPRVDNPATSNNEHSDGYTVFGWVVGGGMTTLNQIANMKTWAYQAPFAQVPLDPAFTQTDFTNGVDPLPYVVRLESVRVIKTHAAYQNPYLESDVNNDNKTTVSDLQKVITAVQSNGVHNLTASFAGTDYLDPTGDGKVSQSDILRIVSALQTATPAQSLVAEPMYGRGPIVPEPGSLALAASAAGAVLGWAWIRRRRRR